MECFGDNGRNLLSQLCYSLPWLTLLFLLTLNRAASNRSRKRTAKWNELLRIARRLGPKAEFLGGKIFDCILDRQV